MTRFFHPPPQSLHIILSSPVYSPRVLFSILYQPPHLFIVVLSSSSVTTSAIHLLFIPFFLFTPRVFLPLFLFLIFSSFFFSNQSQVGSLHMILPSIHPGVPLFSLSPPVTASGLHHLSLSPPSLRSRLSFLHSRHVTLSRSYFQRILTFLHSSFSRKSANSPFLSFSFSHSFFSHFLIHDFFMFFLLLLLLSFSRLFLLH